MDHGALRLVSYNDTAHLDGGFQVSNAEGAGPRLGAWKEQANEHRKPLVALGLALILIGLIYPFVVLWRLNRQLSGSRGGQSTAS